jgi:uracil permease
MTTKVLGNQKSNESSLQNIKNIILGLQHLIAMFGATVLVPILTGFDPSVALVSAGCGTLIFHLCTKGKVPVFLGSSFAFIPAIVAAANLHGGDLRYAQGGIIVAGLIYATLSRFVKSIGVDNIRKVLPSQVVGPMIVVIGLNLVPVAFGMASGNIAVAGITLGTALFINFRVKGFIKQLAILIAVVTGYLVSLAMGLVDTTIISTASAISVPAFALPKFSAGAIMMIAPLVLAVFMEHIGDVTTNGEVVGQDFIKDPGLNRTLLGDGLATIFAGLIGGPANTTYGENTGVLAITKNYDPKVLRIAATFAIGLGFIGKIGGVLKSIPVPVMGGISMMLFSMIALIGVKTIKNNDVKFSGKNLIIMGMMLLIGLSGTYITPYTGINFVIKFTDTITLGGLSLAAIVGIVLNLALNGTSSVEDKNKGIAA